MEIKDLVIQYFDQYPEGTPEEFVAQYPDVPLQSVYSFWQLWKKLAAWKYTQGLEEENLAKLAPRGKKKKKALKEQKVPQSGLGPANAHVQSENEPNYRFEHASQQPAQQQHSRLIHFLADNEWVLRGVIDQFKQKLSKNQDYMEGVDEEVLQIFESTCRKRGMNRSQGLNIALRDFIQRFDQG